MIIYLLSFLLKILILYFNIYFMKKTNNIKSKKTTHASTTTKIDTDILTRLERAKNSFFANWPFWLSTFLSLILIKNYTSSSYIDVFITFIANMYLGYDLHRQTHKRDFTKFYENMNAKYIRNNLTYLDSFIKYFVYFADFHDKIHHDTRINKKYINITLEVIQNLLSEGLAAVIIVYLLQPKITIYNYIFKPHIPTLCFWAILYTTVNNINYEIIHPTEHINHHLNPNTNFGIDILDIIFDTKYEEEGFELMHHAVINIIIIAICIIIIFGEKKY